MPNISSTERGFASARPHSSRTSQQEPLKRVPESQDSARQGPRVAAPVAESPATSALRGNRAIIKSLVTSSAKIRAQIPTLKQTTGKNPRWYIRPYVDLLQPDGTVKRVKQRFYLGYVSETTRNQAKVRLQCEMNIINRAGHVIQQQMPFSVLIDAYVENHVNREDTIAFSTRTTYNQHLNKEIRPELGSVPVAKITTLYAEKWISEHKVSIRPDLKKICRGIFAKAIKWGLFNGKNPFVDASIGKKKTIYQRQSLSDDDQLRILEALPPDMNLFCSIALFCTLRKSEVRGLQWKHIDWKRGLVMVRQRWYKGDIDEAKTKKSMRDVPLEHLLAPLRKMYPGDGHDNDFIFDTRSDLHSPLVRAAKKLNLYWRGFGFHQFRREALTEYDHSVGIGQAAQIGGHANVNQTARYIMPVPERAHQAVKDFQERILRINGPQTDDADGFADSKDIRMKKLGQTWGQIGRNLEELDAIAPSISKNIRELFVIAEPGSLSRCYLEEVFGGELSNACGFAGLDEANEILGLIMRHWNAIAGTLHKGDVYLPMLLEDGEGVCQGNDWARGFMRGMEMRKTGWAELVTDEENGGCVVPVMMLYHEHDEDPELRPGPIDREKREEIIVRMAAGIVHAYRYFRAHPQLTARADEAEAHTHPRKIGRNDPCPCGSGKKYKRCCGGVTIH